MPNQFRKLFRQNALLTVTALFGVLVGGDYAVSVLFAPERAVMHYGHLVFAHCDLPGAEPAEGCVAQYEFILGNTGRQEEHVIVTWPAQIGRWVLHHRLQNIAADEPRSHDPAVACSAPEGQSECIVERLAPGALLILQFKCLPCGGGEIAGLDEVRPELRTEARVYRGDPRISALARRLQVLLY